MDRTTNPFAPGAGTPPPELAGREGVIEDATVALARTKSGRSAKSQMLLGLRGVGKTVLLNEISRLAEAQGYRTIMLEVPEDRRLAEMLVPALRATLYRLSAVDKAKHLATKAMRGLQGFASKIQVKIGELELGVSEPGLADSGNLESDLPDLLIAVGEAAAAAEMPVAVLIDEVQYLPTEDLAALLVSIHRLGQRQLPFVVFGAGLPQLGL